VTGWLGPVCVALVAALLPLVLPGAARAWVPDLAVLTVLAVGFRGTPERAALFGVALGALASLWSPEPLLFRPFVLGATGWVAGQAAEVLQRDRVSLRMIAAALGTAGLHAAEGVAASFAGADAAAMAPRVAATALAAGIAAAAAPLWFALLARGRLLAPLERSFRDV
jgi:cell shape-determining protein MreD